MSAHWYLSFVNDGVFAGACFVEADSLIEATKEAWRHKCNPGGQVMAVVIDYDDPDCTIRPTLDQFNKLYSRDDLEKLFGRTRTRKELEEET